MKKYAVLSMDIEDWYHTDYFDSHLANSQYSLLDGLNTYLEVLTEENIAGSFFVVGDLVKNLTPTLNDILKMGHDIGCHSMTHKRPLLLQRDEFRRDITESKGLIEDAVGIEVGGYRAPCFSLDRERLDILVEEGFRYDSSLIDFGLHPLYGKINMDGFGRYNSEIYFKEDFIEYEMSTVALAKRQIPVSGGGYLRIFPWFTMKSLLERYLSTAEFYTLYIHPFELSEKETPPPVREEGLKRRMRFGVGRKHVKDKLLKLIGLLRENGFEFTTFSNMRELVLSTDT